MEKYRIGITHITLFSIFLLAINYLSSWISWLTTGLVMGIMPGWNSILMLFFMVIINLITTAVLAFAVMSRMVPRQYQDSEESNFWLKNALVFIVLGEILRFILCISKLGNVNSTGKFAVLPTAFYEALYLEGTDRFAQVRNQNSYIFSDVAIYFVCYLIYFAVYLALLLVLYRHFWMKGKAEREDLVYHEGVYHDDSNRRFY